MSYPQYLHLMSLQKKVERLDVAMAKISAVKDPEDLAGSPQWQRLTALRKALVQLLPM